MGENCQKQNMITGYSVCSKQTIIPSLFLQLGAELTELYPIQSRIRILVGSKKYNYCLVAYSHSGIVQKKHILILNNQDWIQEMFLKVFSLI